MGELKIGDPVEVSMPRQPKWQGWILRIEAETFRVCKGFDDMNVQASVPKAFVKGIDGTKGWDVAFGVHRT